MCSYHVQAILQCFYKNMHLPIVLCCDMKIHCLYNKIVSVYQVWCVSVYPFLSCMSMLVPLGLVVGTKDC